MRLKNKYWSIIRSMMPEKVMHLMMKDCIDYQDDPKIQRYKPLIEQAKFFENLSFYGLSANQEFWLIWASSKFDEKVFGENHGFHQIQKSLHNFALIDCKLYQTLFHQSYLVHF